MGGDGSPAHEAPSRPDRENGDRSRDLRATEVSGVPVPVVGRTGAAPRHVLDLQRAAGNRAATHWVRLGTGTRPALQRIALQDGPPLAPGNYRYGPTIVGLKPGAMRATLADMAGRDGLDAEKTWQQTFVTDMRGQTQLHSYEDPDAKQTVNVEPTLADAAVAAQTEVDSTAGATQTQFQQSMLNSVRDLLNSNEKKLQTEGQRYGFPTNESILRPQPVSAGAAAIAPSMPGSDDLRGLMGGAKRLLDGKAKLKQARDTVTASGPILGEAIRPTVLEPAVRDYHALRTEVCQQYPLLASIEREDERLAELAGGAANAGPGATGQPAVNALVMAKEEVRKELADKLSNIAYIRSGVDEPDKVDKFWLDGSLRDNTKRTLGIAPATLQNAAVEAKVAQLQADAEFESRLKQVLGVALLIASFVPGVAPVAGAVGLIAGAVDVNAAFQQYYWEQAAAGTAMEKAEAISQTEPSMFGLALSIAFGLLEGVAEAKALEAAIGVFGTLQTVYREARAAAVAVELGSGAAKTGAAAELVTATEQLKTTADQASGRPGLGDRIMADLPGDVKATALSLDRALKEITDPGLKDLVLKDDKAVTAEGETLMDLAIKDPHGLADDFSEWQKQSGKPFEDWLRDMKKAPEPGILTEPTGLIEYGLSEGEARRSLASCIREDPTREAGVWRDPETGEHVCVQGAAGFVDTGWMSDLENLRNGKQPKWELVIHNHPNRGLSFDRLPSGNDFQYVTYERPIAGPDAKPITSAVAWTDPESKIQFQTEFGFIPGTDRPYWTRYRVDDGTNRIATFREKPGTTAEYDTFVYAFKGLPSDPVPGGNVPPVELPEAPPSARETPAAKRAGATTP